MTPDELAHVQQQAAVERQEHRLAAMQLNDLLGSIHSEADAQNAVDYVARLFQKELPPAWTTAKIRERVARAEFEGVSNPERLIPEQRVAEVWNEFVREIGAPDEALVTAAEIHSVRDGRYTLAQLLWTRDLNRTMWTIPNAFAVGPDGKIADGCRALETLAILQDMETSFINIRSARERLRKGIVASDELQKKWESVPRKQKSEVSSVVTIATANPSPILPAVHRYIQEHGIGDFDRMQLRLFDQLFPK